MKRLAYTILFLSTPILVLKLFPIHVINDSYYLVAAGFFLFRLFNELGRSEPLVLYFDTINKVIHFKYRTIWRGELEKSIPFNIASIEVYKSAGHFFWTESIRLTFLKNKMEVFDIKYSSRYFSVEKIQEVVNAGEKLEIQILYV